MKEGDMEAQEPLLRKLQDAKSEQQVAQARVRMRLAFFTAVWLALGIIVGTRIEGWTLLTSCYVFVQIVTTIGYPLCKSLSMYWTLRLTFARLF